MPRRRVIGTIQLFIGLLVIVVAEVFGPIGNDALLIIGLLLAASCIVWFGVLDRDDNESWQ
jgi:hypothetical protein